MTINDMCDAMREKRYYVVNWQEVVDTGYGYNRQAHHRIYYRTPGETSRKYNELLLQPNVRNLTTRHVDEWYLLAHPATEGAINVPPLVEIPAWSGSHVYHNIGQRLHVFKNSDGRWMAKIKDLDEQGEVYEISSHGIRDFHKPT